MTDLAPAVEMDRGYAGPSRRADDAWLAFVGRQRAAYGLSALTAWL